MGDPCELMDTRAQVLWGLASGSCGSLPLIPARAQAAWGGCGQWFGTLRYCRDPSASGATSQGGAVPGKSNLLPVRQSHVRQGHV